MQKKVIYQSQIVKALYFNGSLSCADLSVQIRKSLPVTMQLLTRMMAEGSVEETGLAPSTGGRRPVIYSLVKDFSFILCVAMDQFVTRIAMVDLNNNFLSASEKIDLPLHNNINALSSLTENIDRFLSSSPVPRNRIIGIGIGMPGFVNAREGINFSFLDTGSGSISEYIGKQSRLPVFIDNDSSLVALAELKFGAGRTSRNVMVMNIGWGLGLGMILNGEIFRGQEGFAGELSHIPVFSNNKLCSCGKSGCLETETSLMVIVENAKKELLNGRSSSIDPGLLNDPEQASEAIIGAVKKGDRFVIELFSQVGYNVGRGVAILIHLLNPELIVLSGRGSGAGKVWLAPIQQAINEHCIPSIAANTSIEMSTLGYEAELIGAAALVMENFKYATLEKILSKESETV